MSTGPEVAPGSSARPSPADEPPAQGSSAMNSSALMGWENMGKS
jgi:hypothetical protein